MLARLLIFAAALAPLYAQDENVTKYLDELRSPRPLVERQAQQRDLLTSMTRQLDRTNDAAQKAATYLRIGELEQSIGQPDAAIAAARNAHDLAPRDEEVSLGLAGLLLQNGQTAEIAALLAVDPTDGKGLLDRAEGLKNTRHYSLAAFCMEQAHKLLPDDQDVADMLGMIYMWAGDPNNAHAVFVQLIARSPAVPVYRYHFAVSLFQRGLREQARTELRTALEYLPAGDDRADIEALLASLTGAH